MESDHLEQEIQESQLQIWQKLMYVALGSAVTIGFNVFNPIRDLIILITLLYTTLAGFYLLWGSPWRNMPLTESRKKTALGHLLGSWLVVFGVFSYSLFPPVGLMLIIYTVFLLVTFWRTRKKLSASDEMFP